MGFEPTTDSLQVKATAPNKWSYIHIHSVVYLMRVIVHQILAHRVLDTYGIVKYFLHSNQPPTHCTV